MLAVDRVVDVVVRLEQPGGEGRGIARRHPERAALQEEGAFRGGGLEAGFFQGAGGDVCRTLWVPLG